MRIEAIWKELMSSKDLPAFRRIDERHPLDIYAGIDENRSPLLLLVTTRVARDLDQFQSLTVRRFRREDGLWSYTLILEDSKLSPVFALLCEDLISTTEVVSTELGTEHFFVRLNRWKALLASGSAGLSEQETRGLLAELYVLKEILAPRFGFESSALGWAGPEAEEQDFRIEDSSFEVKAVPTGKTRIRVASLRQLDCIAGSLQLLVVPMNPASEGRGLSLITLTTSIREGISNSPRGSSAFEAKLVLTGFTELDDASSRPYAIGKPICYEVAVGFPALSPTTIPEGVVEASYTIDLSMCKPFERPLSL